MLLAMRFGALDPQSTLSRLSVCARIIRGPTLGAIGPGAPFFDLLLGDEGEGERGTSDSGSALQCARVFLSELLSALDRHLIVLVKLRHYLERQRYEATERDQDDPFTYAYVVLSISRDLRVEHVVPTQHDFGRIKALDEHTQYEFADRFRALSAVRP
jgi:hypothetical protein